MCYCLDLIDNIVLLTHALQPGRLWPLFHKTNHTISLPPWWRIKILSPLLFFFLNAVTDYCLLCQEVPSSESNFGVPMPLQLIRPALDPDSIACLPGSPLFFTLICLDSGNKSGSGFPSVQCLIFMRISKEKNYLHPCSIMRSTHLIKMSPFIKLKCNKYLDCCSLIISTN